MRLRVGLAVLLLLAFQFVANVNLPSVVSSWGNVQRGQADEFTLYARRFDGVRPQLPAHGRVGYRDLRGIDRDVATRHYYWAQLVLSPVVVDRDAEYPLTVEIDKGRTVRVVRREGE